MQLLPRNIIKHKIEREKTFIFDSIRFRCHKTYVFMVEINFKKLEREFYGWFMIVDEGKNSSLKFVNNNVIALLHFSVFFLCFIVLCNLTCIAVGFVALDWGKIITSDNILFVFIVYTGLFIELKDSFES